MRKSAPFFATFLLLLSLIFAGATPTASDMQSEYQKNIEELKANGIDVSEIEGMQSQSQDLQQQGKQAEANQLLESAKSKANDLLTSLKNSKSNLGWALGGLIILIMAVLVLRMLLKQGSPKTDETKSVQKTKGSSQKKPAEFAIGDLPEDFGERNPDEPMQISVKRKKLDIQ